MSVITASSTRRAIGIVRVSQTAGREGESFASPGEQADRIRAACERDGLELVEIVEELDVSGGTPLERRDGLRQAVEAVEAGQAHVIVAAYFDRLVRSLTVQAEVVERVERAGGQVLAVDVGRVTAGSAGQWLSGTMLGAVSEYQRRTTAERTREAQVRAMARGVAPWPGAAPGYDRGPDSRFVPNAQAPAVQEAFRMRASGATVGAVREHLIGHGIKMSFGGVQRMLSARTVLGELHRKGLEPNLAAHPAIVDRETFEAVQRVKVPRGRKAPSERLLARLGVLHCHSCGARMTVGQTKGGRYSTYRCPDVNDCTRRAAISAERVEAVVVEAVRAALRDQEGRASAESHARQAEEALALAQRQLDALIGLLDPLEPAAAKRLQEATAERDQARENVERLGGVRSAVTVNASEDWDRLSLDARRKLIRATVASVTVAPGRGTDRVALELVS